MEILYHHKNTYYSKAVAISIDEIINALQLLENDIVTICPNNIIRYVQQKKSLPPYVRIIKNLFFFRPLFELIYNFIIYLKFKKIKRPNLILSRYGPFEFVSVWFAKKNKIPVILYMEFTYMRHYRHTHSIINKLIFNKIANHIERQNLKAADAIIVISQELKNYLIAKLEVDGKKIYVIHNGVNPYEFSVNIIKKEHSYQNPVPKNRMIVGFVGSISLWCGLDILIKAIHDLIKSDILKNIHLLSIIQVEEQRLWRFIKKYIFDNNLVNHISFLEELEHSKIPSLISLMDICIIPDHCSYTSPMKLFEYMAMAKPCIVAGTPAIREIIIHGENGYIIKSGDATELKEAIVLLANNKELRDRLGNNARRTILERGYTWENNAKKIIRIYNDVIRTKSICN
ncbi:MAG: glycosyltransferase family 4 protein [Candidatus Omnitrophota bacterium]|nr:glycosyltransferase family 4 protein [Candidatus Omnitrophota bacterium]